MVHYTLIDLEEIYSVSKIYVVTDIILKLQMRRMLNIYASLKLSHQKLIVEKLRAFSSGLYYTIMRSIETYVVSSQKLFKPITFRLWHDRLGHPGSTMMCRIIENSHGHPLKNLKILLSNDNICTVCSQEKFLLKRSTRKM